MGWCNKRHNRNPAASAAAGTRGGPATPRRQVDLTELQPGATSRQELPQNVVTLRPGMLIPAAAHSNIASSSTSAAATNSPSTPAAGNFVASSSRSAAATAARPVRGTTPQGAVNVRGVMATVNAVAKKFELTATKVKDLHVFAKLPLESKLVDVCGRMMAFDQRQQNSEKLVVKNWHIPPTVMDTIKRVAKAIIFDPACKTYFPDVTRATQLVIKKDATMSAQLSGQANVRATIQGKLKYWTGQERGGLKKRITGKMRSCQFTDGILAEYTRCIFGRNEQPYLEREVLLRKYRDRWEDRQMMDKIDDDLDRLYHFEENDRKREKMVEDNKRKFTRIVSYEDADNDVLGDAEDEAGYDDTGDENVDYEGETDDEADYDMEAEFGFGFGYDEREHDDIANVGHPNIRFPGA